MADLRLNQRADEPGPPAAPGGRPLRDFTWDPAEVLASARRALSVLAPRRVWREHRLITILAAVSLLPRILALLAFRPALLTADSFIYMLDAVSPHLGIFRPSGYSAFLIPFQLFPANLLLITILQHLMGIATAVIVYGLLRYYGLPAWGASLAALPTLFDPRQIALESYILPDTLYALVIMVAVALLLAKRPPSTRRCVLVGLLMAYVAVLRANGLALMLVVVGFLLIRRVGRRAVLAAVLAFAVPVLGYMALFQVEYGQFNLAAGDGIFLWSRTTSFANCAIIKPPPQLLPLCPNRERSIRQGSAPAWSVPALVGEPSASDYLWAPDVWWRNDGAHSGFNAYNNSLGLHFALDAIAAQPLGYLRVVARDVMLVFLSTDRPQTNATMSFSLQPHIVALPWYYQRDINEFAGPASNTHPVQPFAYFLLLYQQPVYFPGIVFFLVMLAGLVGVVRNRKRRGGPGALPWTLAAVSIVVPALVTQELYRYVMVAIPLACLAAGLAFARQPGQAEDPDNAGADPQPPPGEAAPA